MISAADLGDAFPLGQPAAFALTSAAAVAETLQRRGYSGEGFGSVGRLGPAISLWASEAVRIAVPLVCCRLVTYVGEDLDEHGLVAIVHLAQSQSGVGAACCREPLQPDTIAPRASSPSSP